MKRKISMLLCALVILSGCTTNGVYDAKKTWTMVGIVAVGSIIASESGGGGSSEENCFFTGTPNDLREVCR